MKRTLLLVVVCLFSVNSFAQTRRVSRPLISPAASCCNCYRSNVADSSRDPVQQRRRLHRTPRHR